MKTSSATAAVANGSPRYPLGLILVATAITIGLAIWDASSDYADTAAHFLEVSRATKVSVDVERIRYLDEVLTMSARMAAATGDRAWISRYEQYVPQLERLIREAKSVARTPKGIDSASATDKANQALVKMETASFALVRQGKRKAALALLTGPEYERWKRAYSSGVKTLVAEVRIQQRAESAEQNSAFVASDIAQGTITILVVGLWCFLLWRVTATWRGRAARYQAIAETLSDSEARYRTLFESSRDAIMTTGPPSWNFTSGNPATLAMFGVKDEAEFTSLGPWSLSPETQPDGRPSVETAKDMMATAMREGSLLFEWTHRRLNGETFPATVLITRTELGGQPALQATVRDITAQKQAEETARRETVKLSTMISGMQQGVVFANADDVIVEANRFMCRFVGKAREEIVGRRIGDAHVHQVLAGIASRLRRFREIPDSEPYVLQRSIGAAEVIVRVQPIYRDGAYDGALLNVIDVTELVKARKDADAANAAKSGFLANMSHEIRTPMTAILGFADMLANSIESCVTCPEHEDCAIRRQSRESIHIIQRNGEHLLGLINDILDLSKIEAGKMPIERTACSPVQLVEEAVSLMRVRAIEKGLSLDARYEFPLPETISSDPARIRQILTNLLGNAVKFTARGRVEVAVRCTADAATRQATIAFAVTDSGIGIGAEQLKGLFQPFVQADSSTTRQYGGTGLGLSISKRLAEALDGDIEVASQPGEGSTFTFTIRTRLPDPARMLNDLAEAAVNPAHASPGASPAVRLSGRILVAEDGEDNRLLISAILRKAGAEVDLAPDGRVAFEKARSAQAQGAPYAAILMDMQMPEMDGYEATRQLRRSGYDRPIIALTAHAMAEDRQKCLAAGCDDYATKPVDRIGLLNMLARLTGAAVGEPAEDVAAATDAPASPDEAMRSQFADDPDMTEVIDAFVAHLPDTLAAMTAAYADQRYDELRRLAHQLKGAGGGYGYPLLTEQARGLEEAAGAADTDAAVRALDELRALTRAISAGRATNVVAAGSAR